MFRDHLRHTVCTVLVVVLTVGTLSVPSFAQTTGDNPSATATVQEYLQRAIESSVERGWNEALEYYLLALGQNPRNLTALIGSARAYYYLARFPAATDAINRALRLAIDNRAAQLLAARIAVASGDTITAQRYLAPIIDSQPRNPTALLVQAEIALAEGRITSAQRSYQTLARANPHTAAPLLALALIAEFNQDKETTESYLQQAIRAEPDSAFAHYLLARHHFTFLEYQQASDAALVASQLAPLDREAMVLRAQIVAAMGDIGEALAINEQLLSRDSGVPQYWLLRGILLDLDNRPTAAVSAFQRALRNNLDFELARITAEHILMNNATVDSTLSGALQSDTAPTLSEQVAGQHLSTAQRNQFSQFRFDEGAGYLEANHYVNASYAYRRGLQLNPYDYAARISYGNLFRIQGFSAKYLRELIIARQLSDVDTSDASTATTASTTTGSTTTSPPDASLTAATADGQSPLSSQQLSVRIDSYTDLLATSVASRWNIDQFLLSPKYTSLQLVVDSSGSSVDMPAVLPYLGQFMNSALKSSEHITVATQPIVSSTPEIRINTLDIPASNYALLVRFFEQHNTVTVSGEIRSSGGGQLLGTVSSTVSGLNRWQRAIYTSVTQLQQQLPVRAQIIARRNSRAVVNVGSAQQLTIGEDYRIVRRDALRYAESQLGFLYPDESVVGSITITTLDDLIAEGTLTTQDFTSTISVGDDVVIFGGSTVITRPTERLLPLYDVIRLLQ